uniref:WGS project CBMI000000000 data, contig CS3069_c004251 n=1 Tax=Fusarium clavum TaxID=2594811 RepID=A0A090MEJ0_9HYPO|nr:unnamed protein product [Fusarium clavum]
MTSYSTTPTSRTPSLAASQRSGKLKRQVLTVPNQDSIPDLASENSDKRWLMDCDPSPYTLEGRPSLQ